MRPAWRLAINSLSERRSRTALLVITVALCAALIAAVACAMASLRKGIQARVEQTVGVADLNIAHIGRQDLDVALAAQAESWPGVALAVPRGYVPLNLANPRAGTQFAPNVYGLVPEKEYEIRPPKMVDGRRITGPGQIMLDTAAARDLEARVGDTLTVVRFGEPIKLDVVGIVEQPALGGLARDEAFVTLDQMWAITGQPNVAQSIDIVLEESADPFAVEAAHKDGLPRGVLLRATARTTSDLAKNVQSSQIGLVIASVLAFLSAAFIILTGLTTNVTERERELAILRCIGGTRLQLAEGQVVVGLIVGTLGAVLGSPFGVLGAWIMVAVFHKHLPEGFAMSWLGIVLAFAGAIVAGLLGAAYPAFQASRTSPLGALSVRALPARPRGVLLTFLIGLALVATHALIMLVPDDGNVVFWLDVVVGMPAMFAGYFLLTVAVTLVIVRVLARPIAWVLRVPFDVLSRTISATPYRHGFTAGAMMVGLSMLVAIWTNGEAVLRDWLGALDFPDAFVNARNLTEETQQKIDEIPGVTHSSAIAMQTFRTDAFGIEGLSSYNTTFIGFDPEPFFEMTHLTWIQGSLETAKPALLAGTGVLVAREFMVARGLGVGDTITLTSAQGGGQEQQVTFDIVGVVTSPGLDIVNRYFDIGEDYLEQAVNAVFGSRQVLSERFGNDGIRLIQLSIADNADEDAVLAQVRRVIGFGVVGSGKQVKAEIRTFLKGTLLIFSTVAITAMLVACFGVANLIIAGIQARQFEFGVLRAIGASRRLLGRLVVGEALIIALTACVLGTIMGTQASWGGQRLYAVVIGLSLNVRLPVAATAFGWGALTLITLGAAWPAVHQLMKRRPRELLAAMKG